MERMNVSVRSHPAGFPVYSVSTGDNEFELSAFGAQFISWTKSGVPVMFANRERAVFDGVAPYRGGAPICFPYFSKGSLLPGSPTILPQHGRARTTVWASEVRETSIVLRAEQPSPDGSTSLACEITYEFGDGVAIEARVTNIGESETPFQLAVHSYWACSDPDRVIVRGLGARFLDNLAGYQESLDPDSSAAHSAPYDRVYPDALADLELVTDRHRITISAEGGAGAVLWNPGAGHVIADLGTPEFVCVESGVIFPAAVLPPKAEYLLHIGYSVQNSI